MQDITRTNKLEREVPYKQAKTYVQQEKYVGQKITNCLILYKVYLMFLYKLYHQQMITYRFI